MTPDERAAWRAANPIRETPEKLRRVARVLHDAARNRPNPKRRRRKR